MATAAEPLSSPTAAPKPRTLGGTVRTVLRPVASLQLTVALFALSVGLVFLGTLAQKTNGIWTVVDKYFWSEVVWVDFQPAVEFGKIFLSVPADATAKGAFPYPGGRLIGALMFANLIAAHALRFKLSWKRSGIFVLHAGLILLFVGEFITREFQVEQQMVIPQGESTNFTVDTKNFELAFAVPDGPDTQRFTVVPASRLRAAMAKGDRIRHPELPVDVEVLKYFANCRPVPAAKLTDNPATAGVGLTDGVKEASEVSGVDLTKESDVPAAYVRLFKKATDEQIGTYLVSLFFDEQPLPGGAEVSLRRTHYYKPFSIYLEKFRFDRYVGTETAKNYSSRVRVLDPERGVDRDVMIAMNEPLRYRGETFYQADFDKRTEATTILQVVRNPGWVLPYLSCVMVTLGMAIHFGIGLVAFLRRTAGRPADVIDTGRPAWLRGTPPPPLTTVMERLIAYVPALGTLLFLVMSMTGRPVPAGPLDLTELARLPVVDGGRVKPLDTVARVNLRLLTHREEYYTADDAKGKNPLPAIRWLMDLLVAEDDESSAFKAPVIRVENDKLIEELGLERREGLRYSVAEIRPKFRELFQAAQAAARRPDKDRDAYDAKALDVFNHVKLALELHAGHTPLVLPPDQGSGAAWRSPADARRAAEERMLQKLPARPDGRRWSMEHLRDMLTTVEDKEERKQFAGRLETMLREAAAADRANGAWDEVLAAYRSGKQDRFDKAVAEFRKVGESSLPAGDTARPRFETYLNETALFYYLDYLYLLAGILTLCGWVARAADPGLAEAFRRGAVYVLIPTLLAHTFTLFGRMYLMDRPLVFVTNLYSSAVFIGWAAVGLCLLIERIFPLGLGAAVAAAAGGGTCIIAHNLAAGGDTLEMMQAVLDTNFWLATHVTTVTLGYSATYVAGLIGAIYVVMGVFTPALKKPFTLGAGPTAQNVTVGRAGGMILYGVVCFAALLSFVGTVLGGIWADQSWGRFWGWDPKENGAVLIVTWNALILHARWCGLVKDRGVAVLALVGTMITTWSWFGTNQLGVGLHAYGFSNKLARGCTITWAAHLGLIGLGLVPKRFWASFRTAA